MFYRSTTLSPSHYAGRWPIPDESQRKSLAVTNKLGIAYATATDSSEKESMLLELMKSFHGYMSKYLVMILRGTIPQANSVAGRESKKFLVQMMPRSLKDDAGAYTDTCKRLHLAFKNQTTEEIYDSLAFCFMRAARKYDPLYTDKVKTVCEGIHGTEEFTASELEARVGADPVGILRSLVRQGYLSSVVGKKRKVVGYKAANWPPPADFFESGPVGFVYVVQMWFRFYLNDHILGVMNEVESDEGMVQLFNSKSEMPVGKGWLHASGGNNELVTPHSEGNCTTSNGDLRYMADVSLLELPLDVSEMNLDWVAATEDKLFKDLTVPQRTILYLHFHKEKSWTG